MIYIHSSSAITAQHTFDGGYLKEWQSKQADYFKALEPNYKVILEGRMLRRMSRIIKMSMATGLAALNDAACSHPDAILAGTGLGCIQDTEKFLTDVIDSEEGTVSPTAFIQSTHNTIGGQIALHLNCQQDNFTYANGGHSFENALSDAMLRINEGAGQVLVGGADEMIPAVYDIVGNMSCGENSNLGEGACFFVLSGGKKENAICLGDLAYFRNQNIDHLENQVRLFLHNNSLNVNDIDAVLLGKSGTEDKFSQKLVRMLPATMPLVDFKKVNGEYFTASAYAYDLAFKMLKNQRFFKETLISQGERDSLRKVLIYNNYKDMYHSFSLLHV